MTTQPENIKIKKGSTLCKAFFFAPPTGLEPVTL